MRNIILATILAVWATLTWWGTVTLIDLRGRVNMLENKHDLFSKTTTSAFLSSYKIHQSNVARQRTLENIVYMSEDVLDTIEQLQQYNKRTSPVSLAETRRIKARWKTAVGGKDEQVDKLGKGPHN